MPAENPTEALIVDGVAYVRQRDGSLRPVKDRTDRARIRKLSDADIERMSDRDSDNPASDLKHWTAATVGMPRFKTDVHAKFDADVVQWFKASGRGYQTRMNAVLRRFMEANRMGQSRGAGVAKPARRRTGS